MNRRVLGVSIVAVWLGALGWMFVREYRPTASEVMAEATLSLSPGATYYTLSLGGQQIGYASNMVDTLPDGIRVEDIMNLELPALGDLHRTVARPEAWL